MRRVIKFTCPKCGYGRWKTKVKGEKWQCRKCGYIKTRIECNDYTKSEEE